MSLRNFLNVSSRFIITRSQTQLLKNSCDKSRFLLINQRYNSNAVPKRRHVFRKFALYTSGLTVAAGISIYAYANVVLVTDEDRNQYYVS